MVASIKDMDKAKRKMKRYCSKVINNIFEQLRYNQNALIAQSGDGNFTLDPETFKVELDLNVNPSNGTQPFRIGNKSSIDLK